MTLMTGPLLYEPFEAVHMADEDKGIPNIYARACAESIRKIKEAFAK